MEIIKIDPFRDPQTVEGVIAAYRESFGGEPWKEGFLCPVCGSSFPLTTRLELCPRCDGDSKRVPLVDFWPRSRVMADFFREMARPGALCIVARDSRGVAGFAWGYTISSVQATDDHLEAPGVHRLFGGELFYLDECAVLPSGQGHGLGRRLVAKIFDLQPHPRALLRTKADSRMYRLIEKIGGKTIMPISKGRVIMSCSLSK